MKRPKRDKLVMVRMTEFEKERAEAVRDHLQKVSLPDLIRHLIEYADIVYARQPNNRQNQ